MASQFPTLAMQELFIIVRNLLIHLTSAKNSFDDSLGHIMLLKEWGTVNADKIPVLEEIAMVFTETPTVAPVEPVVQSIMSNPEPASRITKRRHSIFVEKPTPSSSPSSATETCVCDDLKRKLAKFPQLLDCTKLEAKPIPPFPQKEDILPPASLPFPPKRIPKRRKSVFIRNSAPVSIPPVNESRINVRQDLQQLSEITSVKLEIKPIAKPSLAIIKVPPASDEEATDQKPRLIRSNRLDWIKNKKV